MRIAFDATSVGSGLGGDETLVAGMLRGLVAQLDPAARVDVLAAAGSQLPPGVTGDPRVTVHRAVRRSGPIHFAATGPRWLAGLARRGTRPDLLVTNTHAPVWAPCPVALTVPDLSFVHQPAGYPWVTRVRLSAMIGRQVRQARMVLTISEFCRQDLIDVYRLDPARVWVVPLALDPPLTEVGEAPARLAARGVRGPYLAYLGNLHPRKNVARAIRAFLAARTADSRLADHSFVIAGGRWFAGSDEQVAAAEAPPGVVVFLGRVDAQEREVLLRGARALVYVSTFEGFGLPPVEAMLRGTPVVAADITAIPEVCGDAAVLVDPYDDDAIAAALTQVLTDDQLRATLAERGRERAGRFTVERTGAALAQALDLQPGHVVSGP